MTHSRNFPIRSPVSELRPLMTVIYAYQFFWGILILAAFVGWGRIVQNSLGGDQREPVDWGLAAGWGMMASLVIGGFLSALGIVSRELLIGFVMGGAVFAYRDVYGFFTLNTRTAWLTVLLCFPLIVRYASAVHFHGMSCADDDIAYFPMIVKLLDTGTLIEPFSLRRLAGYGGHTFLQAFVGATGDENNAYLLDRGVALLVAFGLVIGAFDDLRQNRLLAVTLAVLLVVLLPFPLLNSASHLTGLALFLTLFRTLSRHLDRRSIGHAEIWLLGGLVAATGSLRAHYLLVAALTIIVFWLIFYRTQKEKIATYLYRLGYLGLASLVCLAPWMVLLQISSGTFLYPVFSGNHQPEFQNYSAPLDFISHLKVFLETIFHARLALFWMPALVFLFLRKNAAALSLYAASIFGTVAITWIFTYSDVENIHRYVAPFLNAAFIGTLMVFIKASLPLDSASSLDLKIRRYANGALVGVMVIVGGLMMVKDVQRMITHWDRVALSGSLRDQYAEMQKSIPTGAKVLAMVNYPYALDYRQHDIVNIDVPGAASPGQGMPFNQGPQKLKAYLQAYSISHLIFDDLNDRAACLYNRALWQYHRDAEIAAWQYGAPFYLDFMDNVEALARSERIVYRKNGFHVVALNSPLLK